MRKSLNSMCMELEVTLQGQPRSTAEKEELLNKWDELSNYSIGLWSLAFPICAVLLISSFYSLRLKQLPASLCAQGFVRCSAIAKRPQSTRRRVNTISYWINN